MSQLVKIAAAKMRALPADLLGLRRGEAAAFMLEELAVLLDRHRGYGIDLLVLPESVSILGQSVATAESFEKPGPFLAAYAEFARGEGCHVAASCKVRQGGRVYNSCVIIDPKGKDVHCYHKTYLTPTELSEGLTPGLGARVFDTAAGRIGAAVCFDLNFIDLRRQYAAMKPRIIVFPSAYHGGLVQGAWAYECRAFFAGSHMHPESGILDPFGRAVVASHSYEILPTIATVNLDYAIVHLEKNARKFADIQRTYGDDVTIDIPPHIGSAMIVSNTTRLSAADIVRKHDLELLDDFLRRAADANDAARPV